MTSADTRAQQHDVTTDVEITDAHARSHAAESGTTDTVATAHDQHDDTGKQEQQQRLLSTNRLSIDESQQLLALRPHPTDMQYDELLHRKFELEPEQEEQVATVVTTTNRAIKNAIGAHKLYTDRPNKDTLNARNIAVRMALKHYIKMRSFTDRDIGQEGWERTAHGKQVIIDFATATGLIPRTKFPPIGLVTEQGPSAEADVKRTVHTGTTGTGTTGTGTTNTGTTGTGTAETGIGTGTVTTGSVTDHDTEALFKQRLLPLQMRATNATSAYKVQMK